MPKGTQNQNWKLQLRYGRLVTPYKHFTAIADGVAGMLQDGLICRPGNAFMSMKTWATNAAEVAHMVRQIGQQVGFTASDRIQVFETAPEQPPGDKPCGYDIRFVPYDGD